MELKQCRFIGSWFYSINLLIVPYGIETRKYISGKPHRTLLIVPYGIETQQTGGTSGKHDNF